MILFSSSIFSAAWKRLHTLSFIRLHFRSTHVETHRTPLPPFVSPGLNLNSLQNRKCHFNIQVFNAVLHFFHVLSCKKQIRWFAQTPHQSGVFVRELITYPKRGGRNVFDILISNFMGTWATLYTWSNLSRTTSYNQIHPSRLLDGYLQISTQEQGSLTGGNYWHFAFFSSHRKDGSTSSKSTIPQF